MTGGRPAGRPYGEDVFIFNKPSFLISQLRPVSPS
jgi:hypothetical protein